MLKVNEMESLLVELGYTDQVEMASFINALDDRFGEGSGNRVDGGKSWGEVTEDDWKNDPSLIHVTEGDKERVLFAYSELRRNGVRGWLTITTQDWQKYSLWQPS